MNRGRPRTPIRYSVMDRVLQVFTFFVALAVGAVAVVGVIIMSQQDSLQRFCVVARGSNEVNTTSTGEMIGAISLMSNERKVGWELQYGGLANAPVELQIRGPRLPGMPTGPLALALCGVPSTLACDTSVAGVLEGVIDQTGAGGQPLKPIIQAIRDQPWRYYVQANTATFPGGEVSDALNKLCGTP